jgi:hypothetical protein
MVEVRRWTLLKVCSVAKAQQRRLRPQASGSLDRKVLAFTGHRGMICTTVVCHNNTINAVVPDLPIDRTRDERHRS